MYLAICLYDCSSSSYIMPGLRHSSVLSASSAKSSRLRFTGATSRSTGRWQPSAKAQLRCTPPEFILRQRWSRRLRSGRHLSRWTAELERSRGRLCANGKGAHKVLSWIETAWGLIRGVISRLKRLAAGIIASTRPRGCRGHRVGTRLQGWLSGQRGLWGASAAVRC